MDNLEEKIEELSNRLKEVEALLLAFSKTADMERGNRQSSIKFEYRIKAAKLGISPDFPG